MSENSKVKLSIDGIRVTVPKGTLIIDAAEQAGIYIPRFCYHKLLKPYAGCRMCLVEITKGSDRDPRPFPKPQPSCAMTVQEGMAVETKSEAVQKVREGIMEFTLINHPLDCPICDMGGECDLQDIAYLFGREASRFGEEKIFTAHNELNSLITQDFNRCIQCKRCVRWTHEIADDDRLIFIRRGAKTRVSTFDSRPFNSRFGGMTMEVCPVGALTSSVFRFKARSWEVGSKPSFCSECALGCSFMVQQRGGRILRFLSRVDHDVNGPFFCDRGRFAHDWLEHPDRIVRPMARKNGELTEIKWDDVAAILAENCRRVVGNHGPKALAVCTDPSESVESLWAVRRFFGDILGTPRLEHAPAALGLDPDDAPAVFSRLATLENVLTSKNLVLWESDPLDEAPILGLRMKLALEFGAIDGISISPLKTWLGRKGLDEHLIGPDRMRLVLAGVVQTFADRAGKMPDFLESPIQNARKLAATLKPELRRAADAVIERLLAPDAVLLIGDKALRAKRGEVAGLLLAVQLRELVTGEPLAVMPMFDRANSLAALLMGLRTQLMEGPGGPTLVGFTGESTLDWPGEIESGRLKAVFAIGDGLLHAIGMPGVTKLESLDFLGVVTDFMNPLAERADLVIPRTAPWERSGTHITLEGRIRSTDKITSHPAGAWSIEKLLLETAKHLEEAFPSDDEKLRLDLAGVVTTFGAFNEPESDRLKKPSKLAFRLSESGHAFRSIEEPAAGTFGAIVTDTCFRHDTNGMHAENVSWMPEEFACGMNEADASGLNLKDGDKIFLTGKTGSFEVQVKIVDVPAGYVTLPAGFAEFPIGEIGVLADPAIRLNVDR